MAVPGVVQRALSQTLMDGLGWGGREMGKLSQTLAFDPSTMATTAPSELVSDFIGAEQLEQIKFVGEK